MSIVKLRKMGASWFKYVLFLIAAALALSIAFGWGGGSSNRDEDNLDGIQTGIMAKVNDESLDYETFEMRYRETLKQIASSNMMGREVDAYRVEQQLEPFQAEELRARIFDQLVSEMILSQVAEAEGMTVSRKEVSTETKKIIQEQIDQLRSKMLGEDEKDKSDKALDKALKNMGVTGGLRSERKRIEREIDKDMVKRSILLRKLTNKITSEIDSSDEAVRASYDQITMRQITISAEKRSEEQAQTKAEELAKKLKKGADFASLAKENSDDEYKTNGGLRGYPVGKMDLSKELSDPVFASKPGDIVGPIKSGKDFIIVKVESKENNLPEDYKDPKKQKEYKESYLAKEQSRTQSNYIMSAKEKAKIEILDSEMKAFSLLTKMDMENPKKTLMEAIDLYYKASVDAGQNTMMSARSYSQIAYIYAILLSPGMKDITDEERAEYKTKQKDALTQALIYTESNQLRMMRASLLIEDKDFAAALEDLSYVESNAYNNPSTHQQLLSMYMLMKTAGYSEVDEKIDIEREWLTEYIKQMEAQRAVEKEAASSDDK